MKFEGRILSRSNIMSGTSQAGNPWQKQTIICETLATYPKKVALTAFNSTVDTMNQIPDGSVVEAMISVESREYNGKWYTDAFLLNIGMKGNPATFMQQPPQYQPQPMAAHQQPQYQQQSPMANPQPMQQPIQYQQPVQQPAQQVSQAQVQQLLNQRLPQPTSIQFHQSNQQPVQPQQQVTYTDDLPF